MGRREGEEERDASACERRHQHQAVALAPVRERVDSARMWRHQASALPPVPGGALESAGLHCVQVHITT